MPSSLSSLTTDIIAALVPKKVKNSNVKTPYPPSQEIHGISHYLYKDAQSSSVYLGPLAAGVSGAPYAEGVGAEKAPYPDADGVGAPAAGVGAESVPPQPPCQPPAGVGALTPGVGALYAPGVGALRAPGVGADMAPPGVGASYAELLAAGVYPHESLPLAPGVGAEAPQAGVFDPEFQLSPPPAYAGVREPAPNASPGAGVLAPACQAGVREPDP